MKAGVVVFPGSNCEQDLVDALIMCGYEEVVKLWHKNATLENCDFIFLPGGFSYGDYLRSGAIARFSPIMQEVVKFAANGGFVMGICNGFQILTESGLLPGVLLRNTNRLFICDYVFLKPDHTESALTAKMDSSKACQIPIAHGEGRYYADNQTLTQLEEKGQVIFRYCDSKGLATESANPNGSLHGIAGICNEARNVFGIMPHPERVVDRRLGQTDGRLLFESIYQSVNIIASA